jgi:hypothetical protein
MKGIRARVYAVAGALVVGCLIPVGAAPGETVTIEPIKDNTLYETAAGDTSNGAGDVFFAGVNAMGAIRRGVIAFDVAGNVPAGSTINSVELTLNMSMTVAGAEDVALHRLTSDWGEGDSNASFGGGGAGAPAEEDDATWLHTFYPDEFWNNNGGDFVSTQSAVITVAFEGSYTWGSTKQMIADVQSWLDQPGGNFGWILIGNESTSVTTKRFDSRENSDPSDRPKLTIDFTPPSSGCVGDTNNDNEVNVTDLLNLLGVWGPCAGCPEDFNDDDEVNVTDLLALLGNWGPCS